MQAHKDDLEQLTVFTNLLDAYAVFLDKVIKIEEEKGIQILKDSFEDMPKMIEKINQKDSKLGGRVAIWSIKLVAVANSLAKIQTLSLEQKKELAKQIRIVSEELINLNEDLKNLE